jgi:hypothetical protein
MGLFSQRANQKKTAPLAVEVGPWLARARAELPALSESHLMFLAGLHTTLAAQTILAGAQTSILGEGKQAATAKFISNRDSILRFEGFGSSGQRTLGTPGNVLDYKTDWSLRYSIGTSTSEITVPDYRTWNDDIANYARLDKVRTLLADRIAQGPAWVVTDGYPRAADHLTTIRRDREFSPLAHDYCDPQHATTLAPVRVNCMAKVIVVAVEDLGYITTRSGAAGEWLIHLAPDGNRDLGVVRLRAVDAEHSEFIFPDTTGLAPIEGQRVRRRSLRLLKSLVVDLEEEFPAIAALNDTIAGIARASEDPTTWVQAWTDQTLSPQWTVTPGAVIPVAVVITARDGGPMLNRIVAGASSVTLRRRTFTRGMTRKSRQDGRVVIARNAAILTGADGSYQPFLRYVPTPDAREATVAVAASDLPMFWEVFHGDRAGDPTTTTLLLTTGLGTTDNTIVYGNELMAYLDAFCSHAIANGRATTFQTIGLRVPSA